MIITCNRHKLKVLFRWFHFLYKNRSWLNTRKYWLITWHRTKFQKRCRAISTNRNLRDRNPNKIRPKPRRRIRVERRKPKLTLLRCHLLHVQMDRIRFLWRLIGLHFVVLIVRPRLCIWGSDMSLCRWIRHIESKCGLNAVTWNEQRFRDCILKLFR